MWWPSCCHLWRWVVVPPYFFVAKPAKIFSLGVNCLSRMDSNHANRLSHGESCGNNNHDAQIVPNDRAKSEGTISHLHTWWAIWSPPHIINTGIKRDPIPPFKFLDPYIYFDVNLFSFLILYLGTSRMVTTWHGSLISLSEVSLEPLVPLLHYWGSQGKNWNAVFRGGTQIWVGQGCAARASKPIPIFKGDFGQNGYPFLRIFLQKFGDFQGFRMAKTPKVTWFGAQSEKLTHV